MSEDHLTRVSVNQSQSTVRGSSATSGHSASKDVVYGGTNQTTPPPGPSTPRPRLSIFRKFSYGVGHVFNDLCASMWFTYLVLFYHKVILLSNVYAGLLILIGQVADALATPIIGFLCDMTHVRYGRRKLWHLIGTCMVGVSLFFFWHTCLGCQNASLAIKIVYFAIPIIIFQFGWASVQISHLSLIPELTSDKNERVGLNAIRYVMLCLPTCYHCWDVHGLKVMGQNNRDNQKMSHDIMRPRSL